MIIMIKGSWYRVPEQILTDKGLTLADAAAFAYIADRANGDAVTLTAAEIAAETGYSARRIKESIHRLESRNYIAVERRTGSASVYRQLLMPAKNRRAQRQSKCSHQDDVSKYECVINRFDLLPPEQGEEVS